MKDITISRRSLLVSAGLLALAPLAGCGGNSGSGSAAAGSDYTIGVLQLTEHSALDAANDGFVKAIKESGLKVKIDQKNAQNDQSTCKSIADKFVGDNVNLIYAIATPAAQAAAGATADIPIVGCAITRLRRLRPGPGQRQARHPTSRALPTSPRSPSSSR